MTTPPPALRAAEKIKADVFPSVKDMAQIITSEFSPMVEACRVALEKAQHSYRMKYASNADELTSMATPYCNALQLLKETK